MVAGSVKFVRASVPRRLRWRRHWRAAALAVELAGLAVAAVAVAGWLAGWWDVGVAP